MMFLKSGGLATILFVFLVGWIFLADNGRGRIERSCVPIQWAGTVVESIVDLTIPKYSSIVDEGVDSTEYSCQYVIWRIFYEKEYLIDLETKELEEIEQIKKDRNKEGKRFHD
jgi:hypothetical protein